MNLPRAFDQRLRDLQIQHPVAAADVQDHIVGLGREPVEDFGGELGDEGGRCLVRLWRRLDWIE